MNKNIIIVKYIKKYENNSDIKIGDHFEFKTSNWDIDFYLPYCKIKNIKEIEPKVSFSDYWDNNKLYEFKSEAIGIFNDVPSIITIASTPESLLRPLNQKEINEFEMILNQIKFNI